MLRNSFKMTDMLVLPGWISVFVVLCFARDTRGFMDNNDWSKVVNIARCRVRCLSSLQPPSDLHVLRSRPKQSTDFSRCLQDNQCCECLKPCSQPYVSLPLCKRICEPSKDLSGSCERSCEFLHDIYTIHSGSCPPREELSVAELRCEHQCELDIDCSLHTKCCTNGCGHTCQEAWSPFQGMPSIPDKPVIRERGKGGSIDLKYEIPSSQLRDHVLFIIEHRWNVGHTPSEAHMTSWQQIAQTVSTSNSIKDITPGYWYQFRVSAVNTHGSRGVSQPTDPYRLSREPDEPSEPRNLTEGDTIIKNNKIGVIIKWLPPKKSDLPVSRYKIFWSKNKAIPEGDGEHRHVIDGAELHYTIPELEPDTTYYVQIQAISQYGDLRLKSERASIYITTYPLPQKLQKDISAIDIKPLPKPEPVEVLAVHQPFFQNGLIKANVTWELPPPIVQSDETLDDEEYPEEDYAEDDELDRVTAASVHRVLVSWQPEVCIADTLDDGLSQTFSISTQEKYFVIYDLRFACHYSIKVQTVSPEGVTGPPKHISFPTPDCQDIFVKGSTKPDCPTNDPRTPEEPIHPEYSIVINRDNITARLTWLQPPSDTPITGYKVVWGQGLITDMMEPMLDSTTAYTKILSKEATIYSITSLREATTYVAEVRALSTAGDGAVTRMFFSTPILALKPMADPPYYRDTEDNHQLQGSSQNHRPPVQIYPTQPHSEQTNQLGYASGATSRHRTHIDCVLLGLLCFVITANFIDSDRLVPLVLLKQR